MLKIIPPNSQTFDEPPVYAVKMASKGLTGEDRKSFVKRAAAYFIDVLQKSPPKSGEVPIHVIALGDGEHFGPNRNGDYFPSETCERDHSTFTKFAYFYRSHINKNPRRSYGIVKASYYNKPAGRIELLVYLNGTKEAAERNQGLVADEELELLHKGEDIPVSMATRVPYDVCSGCGNKARTRLEYCTPARCVKYGGLRSNIGKTFDDGHTLCAINPVCEWFDISHVIRPADRIAYSIAVYSELTKQANEDGTVVSGAELAEKIKLALPTWYIDALPSPIVRKQYQALKTLTEIEKTAAFDLSYATKLAEISKIAKSGHPVPSKNIDKQNFLISLGQMGVMLPPKVWADLFGAPDFSSYLPGSFTKLSQQSDVVSIIESNPYISTQSVKVAGSVDIRPIVSCYSIKPFEFAIKTASYSPHYVTLEKEADERLGQVLAREYALYQLAVLSNYVDSPDFRKMAAIAVSVQF